MAQQSDAEEDIEEIRRKRKAARDARMKQLQEKLAAEKAAKAEAAPTATEMSNGTNGTSAIADTTIAEATDLPVGSSLNGTPDATNPGTSNPPSAPGSTRKKRFSGRFGDVKPVLIENDQENVWQNVIVPVKRTDEELPDMFGDEDEEELFGDPNQRKMTEKQIKEQRENLALTDNWDDSEGYYIFRLGDIVQGRYEVFQNQGRGVFSSVLRVRDREELALKGHSKEYVIKVIRNNDTMRKAGMKESSICLSSAKWTPRGTKHCVRLFNHFEHRNHLCLVFEPMNCNLRQLIRSVGAGRGFHISAVQAYSKQLFKALHHLVRCRIIHADIKPDNLLVSKDHNVVKVCDFGSALKPEEVEVTPVMGSRYYRSAEVMIGHPADFAVDMWALSCVLAEVYTGKILFRGDPDNNKMLSLIIPLCGRYPMKFGKQGMFWTQHFDTNGDFLEQTEDVNGLELQKRHSYTRPTQDWLKILHPRGASYQSLSEAERSKVTQFKDLLQKMFLLDPSKRITPQQALLHPFCKGKPKHKNKDKTKKKEKVPTAWPLV
eukprot:TRINITY_DN134_c0_g2_i2.p1 TRINITY_DN134_c0_g2~~TRINITY_DN134_c0_g2_i2.p1  ORF type:complete len:546 (-),score=127.85 TRINITY_DN134_c0_g2_i2:28-1665(-)